MPEIEEIWIIARRKERLEDLAKGFSQLMFRIMPLDLSSDKDLVSFREHLEQHKPDVKLLINNAGIVASGEFRTVDFERQKKMIYLNGIAPTALPYYTVPYMSQGSMLINVCSVAGFAPLPKLLVYSSTKAYLLNFTDGLRAELKKRKIKVLALCPSNMRTEMFTIERKNAVTSRTNVERLPFLNVNKVAHKTLKKAKKGKAFYTPHIFYKTYRFMAKVLPRSLVLHIVSIMK